MTDQWRRQEDSASEGRRIIHDKVDAMSMQLTSVSGKVDGVTQDVAELKNDLDEKVMPTVDAYKADIARKVGALWASKLFWGLITALAAAVGFAVHEVLLYFGRGTGIH